MALLHTRFEWLHNQKTSQLDFPCQMQVYDLYFKIMTSLHDENLRNTILPNFISKPECGSSEVQHLKPENKLGTILTQR
jgi:hypothetical protein